MNEEEELKKGCGMQLKVGQGNLSPNKTRELGVGIKCGEKYVKDRVHRRKELIGKVIYCDRCEALIEGFQKGKLEGEDKLFGYKVENKELKLSIDNLKKRFVNLTARYNKHDVNQKKEINRLHEVIEHLEEKLEQLQKEINSQTEQNSDKEVAQPYSKSDTTTKGFILSDGQFQKEVDFAKKEIGGERE